MPAGRRASAWPNRTARCGPICPVATSATLGEGDGRDGPTAIREVAEQVFGIVFDADSLVGEVAL